MSDEQCIAATHCDEKFEICTCSCVPSKISKFADNTYTFFFFGLCTRNAYTFVIKDNDAWTLVEHIYDTRAQSTLHVGTGNIKSTTILTAYLVNSVLCAQFSNLKFETL